MRLFFFILLLLLGVKSYSQQPYLNKTFVFDNNNFIQTIIPTDSGYILGGVFGSAICFVDSQANNKWLKTYYDQTGMWGSYTGGTSPNALISTNHNTFIAGGVMQNSGPTANKVFSVKYSNIFDTLYLKLLLQDTITTNNYIFNSFVSNNGNYIFVGHSGFSGLIILTDSNSNFIDSSLILKGNNLSLLNAGLQIGNNYYLFGATTSYAPAYVTGWDRRDGWVVKTDLQGNEISSAAFGNAVLRDFDFTNCILAPYNKIATILKKSLQYVNISWGIYIYKTGLLVLNDDLSINKEIYFTGNEIVGDSIRFSDVSNVILDHDSSFVFLGSKGIMDNDYYWGLKKGLIVKMNKNYKINYAREYVYPMSSGVTKDFGVSCISNTGDKGYVFGGYVRDNAISSGITQSWLVKTDSLGCDGFHSCDDTTLVCQILNAPDTVCKNDTAWLQVRFKGRSAPYFVYANTTLALDSVYYPYTLPLWIDTLVPYYPTTIGMQQVIIKVIDPWGWNRSDTVQIYVKNCSPGVIEEAWYPKKVEIYPNPVTTHLNIKFRYALIHPVTITIYNMQGKLIKQSSSKQNEIIIDINDLEQGVYGIRVVGNNVNVSERFVKL